LPETQHQFYLNTALAKPSSSSLLIHSNYRSMLDSCIQCHRSTSLWDSSQ